VKDRDAPLIPRPKRPSYAPGTYVACQACGRLLKIEWAARSIVCSCGARIDAKGTRK
jgi:DNA-directed RNA polymerase subunit RPC12/RpoP